MLTITRYQQTWSLDRGEWLAAGRLRKGEHVKLAEGECRVELFTQRTDPQPVYNLEVDADHVYRVTSDGLLVHNALCPSGLVIPSKKLVNPQDAPVLFGQRSITQTFSDDFRMFGDDIWEAAEFFRRNPSAVHRVELPVVAGSYVSAVGEVVAEGNKRLAALSLAGYRPSRINLSVPLPGGKGSSEILKRLQSGNKPPLSPLARRLPASSIAVTDSRHSERVIAIVLLPGL